MRIHDTKNELCLCNQHPDYVACCDTLHSFINDCRVGFKYHSAERMFTFPSSNNARQGVDYCPWCGTKLPEDLFDKRVEILEEEYGIDAPYDGKQKKNVPAEFLTDEWWVKRNL